MTTTTPGAIRDVIIARIAGLTPPAPLTPLFVAHREEMEIVEWGKANSSAALRRFTVDTLLDSDNPETTDAIDERVPDESMDIVMLYGANNRFGERKSLADVIAADKAHIRHHAGMEGFATYATTAPAATVLSRGRDVVERVGPIWIVTIPLRVSYWRAFS